MNILSSWSHLLNHKVLAEFQQLSPFYCHYPRVLLDILPASMPTRSGPTAIHKFLFLVKLLHLIFLLSWFLQNSHKSKKVLILGLACISLHSCLYELVLLLVILVNNLEFPKYFFCLGFVLSYFLRTSIIVILQSTRHITNYSYGLIESCICDNFHLINFSKLVPLTCLYTRMT